MDAAETKRYELMIIIDGTKTDADLEKSVKAAKELLGQFTDAVLHEDVWGRRNLTYPMQKKDVGYYMILSFEALPEKMADLDAALRLEPAILRHLVQVVPKNAVPKSYASVMADIPTTLAHRKLVSLSAQAQAEQKEKKAQQRKKVVAKAAVRPKKAEVKADAKPKPSLEEVEEKLKKIVENPDINFTS